VKPEVQEYLKKADRALRVAETLLATGFDAEAAARAYCVMFYAAQALLKENGIQRAKHSAVQATFGQHLSGSRVSQVLAADQLVCRAGVYRAAHRLIDCTSPLSGGG